MTPFRAALSNPASLTVHRSVGRHALLPYSSRCQHPLRSTSSIRIPHPCRMSQSHHPAPPSAKSLPIPANFAFPNSKPLIIRDRKPTMIPRYGALSPSTSFLLALEMVCQAFVCMWSVGYRVPSLVARPGSPCLDYDVH